jgi:recombinational DNA repair protein (RecF pathway)
MPDQLNQSTYVAKLTLKLIVEEEKDRNIYEVFKST